MKTGGESSTKTGKSSLCKLQRLEQGHPRGFYATCFYKLVGKREGGGHMKRLLAAVDR